MTDDEQAILKLGQSIYLTKNGSYNDVDGLEALEFIDQTIDEVNQFIEELEMETDWNYVREKDSQLGTITSTTASSYPIPDEVRKLVISPFREVTISQDGSVISRFALVHPTQIADPANPDTRDRATVIGRNLVFSRTFKEEEQGGTLAADVINIIPRLERDNIEMLDIVKPKQLIILGVAKNATLPDIVQGGISPALAQKYADLLGKALMENAQTSESYDTPREDLSFIRGVW